MTNAVRANHVARAEVAALKMACPDAPADALRELFAIIVEAALDAVSTPAGAAQTKNEMWSE